MKADIPVATYWMVGAACISYGGYEFSRAATITLMLSDLGANFIPPALISVAFTSAVFVVLYRKYLKRYGARSALIASCTGLAVFFYASALLLSLLPTHPSVTQDTTTFTSRKALVFVTYVIRQAYCTFLASQQFSFIVSLLETNQDSLGPIYACSSLASALAAYCAASLLPVQSLCVGATSLMVSCILANKAYAQATSNINVAHRLQDQASQSVPDTSPSLLGTPASSSTASLRSYFSLPGVFQQNSRLYTLFIITGIMQAIVSLLALSYSKFLETDLNENDRTKFVGRFYALANFTSALVQFLGLRLLVKHLGLDLLMIVQPLLICVAVIVALMYPTLHTSAFAVLVFKTIEYSLFSGVKDLTYLPLSFQARFVAKEYTDVFSYRAGKCLSAISLTVVGICGYTLTPWTMLLVSLLLTGVWLFTSYRALVKEQSVKVVHVAL